MITRTSLMLAYIITATVSVVLIVPAMLIGYGLHAVMTWLTETIDNMEGV